MVEIQRHGAKHTVPEPVHALRDRSRRVGTTGFRAHPLQFRHIRIAAALNVRLDHAVVAAGREYRSAVNDYRGTASALERGAADVMCQLMGVPEHGAVCRGSRLERIERGAKSIALNHRFQLSHAELGVRSIAAGQGGGPATDQADQQKQACRLHASVDWFPISNPHPRTALSVRS